MITEEKSKKLGVSKWDVTEYLDNEEAITAYIEAAIEENDPKVIVMAIGDIAKARGMTSLAKKMGVKRESLYKSFSGKSKPEFETIYKALDALNLRICVSPK